MGRLVTERLRAQNVPVRVLIRREDDRAAEVRAWGARSLYCSTQVAALRALHPDVEFLREVSDETRLIVSEPLGDLPGVWNEVPEGSYGVVRPGGDNLLSFAPQPM